MTDYKKYALGQVENFLYDAMSAEATPQEIYDVIRGVVSDNYYTYKHQASQAYELLSLLNGHRSVDLDFCDKDDTSEECKQNWNDFWQYTDEEIDEMCAAAEVKDKVKKWVLPVEEEGDDCVITFPDDLLEAANLKEGDQIEWIPQDNGSCILKKVEVKN
jgi:antitoxin component of MazEF toxin-antitoxin module